MLADGEEIHYPCTTSLGVPSPDGLGVSIDSVDPTSTRTGGFPRKSPGHTPGHTQREPGRRLPRENVV